MRYIVVFIMILATTLAHGAESRIETLTGTAFKKDKLVYTEEHTTKISETGQVLEATTVYNDSSGKEIAHMHSDFSKSISAPAHEFKDARFNQRYGLRYEGKKLLMYAQEGDEPEKTKVVDTDIKKEDLLIGGQGLAYYFRSHVQELIKSKKVSLHFLIPGRLETYNFELVYKDTDPKGIALFEIHIKNWFLRIFAPKLILYYDLQKNRLQSYEGLSNLYDEKKDLQNVLIKYAYPN